MRSYITTVDGDLDLLPYFAKYYAEYLGVTEFCLITFGSVEDRSKAYYILKKYADVITGPTFEANKFLAGTRDKVIRSIHRKGEWAYFTDMDEFPAINIEEAKKTASNNEECYIGGNWIDRVAIGGELIDINPNKKLVEQFPMCGNTRKFLKMHTNIYIASRYAPTSHHPSACRIVKWPPKTRYVVHHFKWTASVARRLKTRYKRVLNQTRNKGWAGSIARTVRMLEQYSGVPKHLLCRVSDHFEEIDV